MAGNISKSEHHGMHSMYEKSCGSMMIAAANQLWSSGRHSMYCCSLCCPSTARWAAMRGLHRIPTPFTACHSLHLMRQAPQKVLTDNPATGLVAITSGCSVVQTYGAVLIGAIAAPVYLASSAMIVRLKIDDPSDASAVHFFNGIWGILAGCPTCSIKAFLDTLLAHVSWLCSPDVKPTACSQSDICSMYACLLHATPLSWAWSC